MHKIKQLVVLSALIVITAIQAGCASFRGGEVADAAPIGQYVAQAQKPSVFVSADRYFAEPDDAHAAPLAPAKKQTIELLQKAVSDSGYFSAVYIDEEKKAMADYQIEFAIYNHGNMPLAFASGFLCGFTFGIIPGYAKDNYTVKAHLVNNREETPKDFSNKDSMNTWIGLWFIPLMGKSPMKVSNQIAENQVRDILNKMVESGALSLAGTPDNAASTAAEAL